MTKSDEIQRRSHKSTSKSLRIDLINEMIMLWIWHDIHREMGNVGLRLIRSRSRLPTRMIFEFFILPLSSPSFFYRQASMVVLK